MSLTVFASVVFMMGREDFKKQVRLVEHGGVRWHCATLGQKVEVLDSLFAKHPKPRVIIVNGIYRQWGGCGTTAWLTLMKERWNPEATISDTTFYIMEPDSQFFDKTYLARMDTLPVIASQKFRSVVVIESEILDQSLGR